MSKPDSKPATALAREKPAEPVTKRDTPAQAHAEIVPVPLPLSKPEIKIAAAASEEKYSRPARASEMPTASQAEQVQAAGEDKDSKPAERPQRIRETHPHKRQAKAARAQRQASAESTRAQYYRAGAYDVVHNGNRIKLRARTTFSDIWN
jgi:hypothetical protein